MGFAFLSAQVTDHAFALNASSQVKVGQLWAQLGGSGRVERLVSWDHLLADDELAKLIGNADLRTGKAMLAAMREMRALGANAHDKIAKSDFYGLFDPNAINEAKLYVFMHRNPLHLLVENNYSLF